MLFIKIDIEYVVVYLNQINPATTNVWNQNNQFAQNESDG